MALKARPGVSLEAMARGCPVVSADCPSRPREILADGRLFRACLENTTAMARTRILRDFPHEESFALGSDYDLWARIAAHYPMAALPQALVFRRAHSGQSSAAHDEHSKGWRLHIFAWQLRALDLRFTAQDLERHNLLRRMHKQAFTPDSEFLDWAESWLLRLQTANGRAALYPEPAFSGVLGECWLNTCWRAGGARPWRRFWTSPLRPAARLGSLRFARSRIKTALPWLARTP